MSIKQDHWTVKSALAGAALWAALAAAAGLQRAPFGIIELLFLLAPLVVVPLGVVVSNQADAKGWPALENAARRIQPLAALMVMGSFWMHPGPAACTATIPWLLVCGLMALSGLKGLVTTTGSAVPGVLAQVGRLHLAIGGAWLVTSRLGVHPSGFQEPIILLTAVHFHYSGFGLAMIAAATLRTAEARPWRSRLLAPAAISAVFMPFVLAGGFITSPLLKGVAAAVLAASVVVFAAEILRLSLRLDSPTARLFLRAASFLVFTGMLLAMVYAVGDYLGRQWLAIPQMASTHGVLNGPGFVLLALLGWLAELHLPVSDRKLIPPAVRVSNRRARDASQSRNNEERLRFAARDFYDR